MRLVAWTALRKVLRVAIPLAFVVVTSWTVWDLASKGAPPPRGEASTDGSLADDATSESATPDPEATAASDPTEDGEATEDPAAPPDGAVTVAVAADIGSDARGKATLDAMSSADPDLNLMLGDLSYAGPDSERDWCRLVRARLGPVAPVQLVAGNHEEDTGEDGRIKEFARCLDDRMNSRGTYAEQYWFDIGDLARVILISPDLTIDRKHYYYGDGNAEQRWLVNAIESARAQGKQWVIVGMHKNCISMGEYYCRIYQDLFDVLINKRVDLVLHGHEHSYQRSKQLQGSRPGCRRVRVDDFDEDCVVDDGGDDRYRQGMGPVFLVAGVGGADLYPVREDDPEAGYFAATMGAGPGGRQGFTKLILSPDELAVEFVGSSPGDFEDAFQIEAKPG